MLPLVFGAFVRRTSKTTDKCEQKRARGPQSIAGHAGCQCRCCCPVRTAGAEQLCLRFAVRVPCLGGKKRGTFDTSQCTDC
jgi:hypothetical protein